MLHNGNTCQRLRRRKRYLGASSEESATSAAEITTFAVLAQRYRLLAARVEIAPSSIAHSTKLKEMYENLQIVLGKINYWEHQWKVCGDLKVSTLILDQQSGFTKNSCFLCLWDSRDRKYHYRDNEWPKRTEFHSGTSTARWLILQIFCYLLFISSLVLWSNFPKL